MQTFNQIKPDRTLAAVSKEYPTARCAALILKRSTMRFADKPAKFSRVQQAHEALAANQRDNRETKTNVSPGSTDASDAQYNDDGNTKYCFGLGSALDTRSPRANTDWNVSRGF